MKNRILTFLSLLLFTHQLQALEIEKPEQLAFEEKGRLEFTGLKTDILIGEADGVELKINIALPENNAGKARPGLVLIHGGGLISGDKDRFNERIEAMAKRGVVSASVMYRLAPEHRFPAAIEDVKAAIRFLKANAEEFHLDTERIIVMGVSSGGYLATMIGVTGNATEFSHHGIYPEFDSSVRAVISQAGHIADFTDETYRDFAILDRFLPEDYQDRNHALAAISPVTYLDENDPPFFLSHGSADERVPVSMTRDFVDELKAIDHVFEYIEVEGGKHSLSESRPKEASEVFSASMAFFQKYAF